MGKEFNFDDMRSFRDEEINAAINRVIKEETVQKILKGIFPDEDFETLVARLKKIDSIYEFQHAVIVPFIQRLAQNSKSTISFNGLEYLHKDIKYLFISNHRDIIMDAAILNTMLDYHGWETTEIAIGDNLCANEWITDCLKMNRCFLVKRSGTRRELFEAFIKLSTYIRRNISEMRNSVWIAQREGRAKDSNDHTQESLLKMLSTSAVGSMKQCFIELNIAPFTISYEYDSCDYLKAKEFQQKRDDENFEKTKADDVLNMKVGILGNKGQIYYELTPPINDLIEEMVDEEDNRQTVLNKIAEIIDLRIHQNYHIFPVNYIAFDKLHQTQTYLGNGYTEDERKKFEQYVAKQIEKIDLPNKDIPFLEEKFWLMYANPLINHLKAKESLK